MNGQIITQLEDLHFSSSEARVYAALAELGQSPSGAIIKKTSLHRSVVYESLDKLIAKKLAYQVTKNKKAYFQLTNPDRLRQAAQTQLELASQLVPQLKSLAQTQPPEIIVYEGAVSYQQYWLNLVKTLPVGTTDFVAGSITPRWQQYMGTKMDEYIRTRIKRKIKWKMIVYDKKGVDTELLKKYPSLHEYRLIPRQTLPDGNFNIWGNDMLLLHSAVEPLLIEIRNTALVSVFRNIFDILWEAGRPIN